MTQPTFHLLVVTGFCLLLAVQVSCETSECQPTAQFAADIPCVLTGTVLDQLPFCGSILNTTGQYSLDARINLAALDAKTKQQLELFNTTYVNVTERCYEARKVLSCALAFPQCTNNAFTYFPCNTVCKYYFTECGQSSGDCRAFPSQDCVPLSFLMQNVTESIASTILIPSFFVFSLLLLFTISI